MVFQFFIGGYFSGHFEVVLKGEELHFFVSDFPLPIQNLEPTHIISIRDDVDWKNMIDHISNLNWASKYDSPILDGIQWELSFKNKDTRIKSYGSNALPENFDSLLALLKKITIKHNIPDQLLDSTM